MSFIEGSIDVAVALGKGVYSVGEDIALGVQRTGEGLGLGNDGRMVNIGYENRAAASLLHDAFKYAMSDHGNPLYKSILLVLEHYYSYFPESAITLLANKAGIAAGYSAGRMLIGKKLAEVVASKIAIAIAASSAYRQIAKRIGVSAGASATGVGLPIGLLMMQGLMQRSSHAAMRLRQKSPELYFILQRNGDLQLIYFLLEKPMEKYIHAISAAEQNYDEFIKSVNRKYDLS